MFKIQNQEKFGTILALINAAAWGSYIALINYGTQTIPPLKLAAATTLLAGIASFLYASMSGKLRDLKNTKAYFSMLMVTIFIVIIPYSLIFIGTSKTSGMNTSSLLLTEIIFTVIFTHFIGEKTTKYKLLGAGGVFLGGLLILCNGTMKINIGDLLIILSTAFFPIGNFYAKKALNLVAPAIILFVRFFIGGIFIFLLSLLLEPKESIINIISNHWLFIFCIGFLLQGIEKIIWYESLKRLDISKAISLIMSFPIFSLIILTLVLKEPISTYQWSGIAIMMIGVYYSILRPSVDPLITKYSP